MDWVFHVDTDELMYPASSAEYSLQVRLFLRDPPCRGVTLRGLLIQRGRPLAGQRVSVSPCGCRVLTAVI